MAHRIFVTLCALALLGASGGVVAQKQPGETSGPAAGKSVEPTTSIQKRYGEGRSGADETDTRPAAGMPGVEGKPGTESGPAPREDTPPDD